MRRKHLGQVCSMSALEVNGVTIGCILNPATNAVFVWMSVYRMLFPYSSWPSVVTTCPFCTGSVGLNSGTDLINFGVHVYQSVGAVRVYCRILWDEFRTKFFA